MAVGSMGSEFLWRVVILLFFTIWGILIIASGQFLLAVRETALNTRNEKSKLTTEYNVLLTISKVNNFFGWIIIATGVIITIIVKKPF